MYYIKKFIIKNFPNGLYYSELVLDNCLHDIKYDEDESPIDVVLKDSELTDIVYNLMLFGNLKSRTNKNLSVHSRLHSFDEDDKHQMSIEIEKYQRVVMYLDKVLIISLMVGLFSFFYLIFLKLI